MRASIFLNDDYAALIFNNFSKIDKLTKNPLKETKFSDGMEL